MEAIKSVQFGSTRSVKFERLARAADHVHIKVQDDDNRRSSTGVMVSATELAQAIGEELDLFTIKKSDMPPVNLRQDGRVDVDGAIWSLGDASAPERRAQGLRLLALAQFQEERETEAEAKVATVREALASLALTGTIVDLDRLARLVAASPKITVAP